MADAPSSITAFYRLFFSALLLPPLLLKKENRQSILSLSKKQRGLGLVSGLFLAVHYVLWFESLSYTSVASSTVIVTLQPLFSFAGGYFLFQERFQQRSNRKLFDCHERLCPHWLGRLGIVITLAGLALFLIQKNKAQAQHQE